MDLVKEENRETIDEDDNFLPSSVSNIKGVKTKRYLGRYLILEIKLN